MWSSGCWGGQLRCATEGASSSWKRVAQQCLPLQICPRHVTCKSSWRQSTATNHRIVNVRAAQGLAHTERTSDEQSSTSGSSFESPAPLFIGRHGLVNHKEQTVLKNLTLVELDRWCLSEGESAGRALQLWRWMYYDDCWIQTLEETIGKQNGFSKSFCEKAQGIATVDGGLQLQQAAKASDGTTKLVFKLTEGEGKGGVVETVLIPAQHRQGGKLRLTLCVSSQVGCAMNCQFCYTGRMGLMANLSTAQIVEQMVEALRVLKQDGAAVDAITNVVFMGMGEPFHNLESVLAAVEIMCHPLGLHMSHNKVTVSTVGLVDELEMFQARSKAQLAVSLHATTDEVRDWIVPVNRRHKLGALMAALRHHYPRRGERDGPTRGARRVLIEYTMLSGINDTLEDAQRLVELLEGVEAKVNLIMFNPYRGTQFQSSSIEQVLAFRSVMVGAGRVCTIRDSRGDDEMAACGQLGNPQLSTRAGPILDPPERFKPALLPSP